MELKAHPGPSKGQGHLPLLRSIPSTPSPSPQGFPLGFVPSQGIGSRHSLGMLRIPPAAASRMIANSLSRDSLPAAPLQPHGSKLSVTVPNKPVAAKAGREGADAAGNGAGKGFSHPIGPEPALPPSIPAGLGNAAAGIPSIPVKRRRVTAEMEGKYIITMPKGTTPRTRKILEQQQAAKGSGSEFPSRYSLFVPLHPKAHLIPFNPTGLPRTSVFDRLGAEARGDPAAGGKVRGDGGMQEEFLLGIQRESRGMWKLPNRPHPLQQSRIEPDLLGAEPHSLHSIAPCIPLGRAMEPGCGR